MLDDLLQYIPSAAHAAEERLEALEQATGHHRVVLESVLPYVDPNGKQALLDRASKTLN